MMMFLSCGIMALLALTNIISAEELQTVDQTELLKLITDKQYIVALFCPSTAVKKCGEFEGELISIGEDLLEVMGEDVRVVKLMDSPILEEYTVEKTDQPVIIMFRNSLPVIYDGVYSMSNRFTILIIICLLRSSQ